MQQNTIFFFVIQFIKYLLFGLIFKHLRVGKDLILLFGFPDGKVVAKFEENDGAHSSYDVVLGVIIAPSVEWIWIKPESF